MTIDMSQFFQVFFDEADELLAEKEKLLLAVDLSAPDPEDLNAIFRAAHSIKGGASTFGLNDMTEVTHVLESLLDKIRKGEMALTAEHVDAFLIAKDILKMQLDGHRLGTPVDQDAVADVRMLLQSLSQDSLPIAPPVISLPTHAHDADELDYQLAFKVELPDVSPDDAVALMAELGLLGAITRAADEGNRVVLHLRTNEGRDDIISICSFILNPDCLIISEESIAVAPAAPTLSDDELGYGFFEPLDAMFPPLEGAAAAVAPVLAPIVPVEVKPLPKKEQEKVHATQEQSTIRVGIEKVDQLINLIGELVITQAMLEQRTQELDPIANERLLSSVSHLTRNTRDLQEAVMSIRMMPMDYVFSRFPRMVRDLATKLGKKVEFVTYGASTELDKGLIERIVDPLTHLVRNSIDHGIEMPAVRSAAGKFETGRLSLSAVHQGGNIVIEVSDDGGGLHRDKILAKASQNGLAVSDAMSDSEVWQLIFAPGFSTAEIVTDVSGRGVGMDVVKRNISAMGGVVDIRSAKGYGTTIMISLPLTLAILDGMSIRLGEEIYILPLGFVVESLQPAREDVKEVNGKGTVIKVRGEYLPLVPLYQLFALEPKFLDPAEGIIVIVEVDGKKAALFVDDLVGQQQVVVKNIESNYKKIPGVSGATILGDGGVALILDVAALLRSTK
ncbi:MULTISPECIES: chemotaxis protein CheA [unclassified Undibacterium]|uniref:chemotaxis protein CheA n=1 Tax=unclassified Undibacterium TaxID=2630295 RepID=UPI002AC9C9BA|nr:MULTISPECIES: chemotaxis protein CheA [unclassified Undibacterium]MEB0138741.1 chemotaxis protein CheA [Undibacterium sp. CCC2.1]MEB0171542.1 chemotaxis protein CheA [Undibacterium sp. CCC1.1]MEB0175387.1 chemotaxis protein CheA [Undibacterium sp. CCC3.4]MEB0214742.1 chemotaxis protein CheA [Undibacterium sp. 5I2]WPX43300.1 chemotaxis protein CheA [Undibacterium sp. CCC3.4]